MKVKLREDPSQKNLEVNLSSTQEEIARWLADLPEQEVEKLDWLIEEIDYIIDSMEIQQSGLAEAKHVLSSFTKKPLD
jgi:hypothetical protein